MIDFGTISNVVGVLLISLGCFMLTALPFSWYFASGDALAILSAAGLTILVGGLSSLASVSTVFFLAAPAGSFLAAPVAVLFLPKYLSTV